MKKVINQVSKHCLIQATMIACAFAVLSNTIFTEIGTMAFSDSSVNFVNNVIDGLQLCVYVTVKLITVKRLTSYDLPFMIGGVVAIFC